MADYVVNIEVTDVLTLNLPSAQGVRGTKGDKGDTGPKGDKGDIGDTGPQGDKGDTGDQGPQGDKGDIGDTGPQGDKGDTGDIGPQGDKGDTGDTGPQGDPGSSAFADITSGTNTNDLVMGTGGTFSATGTGTIAATSSVKLATARAINGVDFDGTAPITVTAAANTLTGNTLAGGVTASSLTSVGTLTNLTVTNPISGTITGNIAESQVTNLTTDLAAKSPLAGSSSIVTLGTITTGIWNGATIDVAHGGTNATTANGGLNNLLPSQTSNSGKVLQTDGSNASWQPGGGTVTSVAMTTPGVLYSVSGSPITASGTLALSLINQSANVVLAGPSSGGSAAPAFRALVTADIPSTLNVATLTENVSGYNNDGKTSGTKQTGFAGQASFAGTNAQTIACTIYNTNVTNNSLIIFNTQGTLTTNGPYVGSITTAPSGANNNFTISIQRPRTSTIGTGETIVINYIVIN